MLHFSLHSLNQYHEFQLLFYERQKSRSALNTSQTKIKYIFISIIPFFLLKLCQLLSRLASNWRHVQHFNTIQAIIWWWWFIQCSCGHCAGFFHNNIYEQHFKSIIAYKSDFESISIRYSYYYLDCLTIAILNCTEKKLIVILFGICFFNIKSNQREPNTNHTRMIIIWLQWVFYFCV